MIEKIIKADSIQEAKDLALKELKVNPDYISFEEIDINTVRAFVNKDIEIIIYEYLSNFFKECNTSYSIDVHKEENTLSFVIDTSENSLFIGREGKVLNSLQFIVRQIAFTYDNTYKNVSIDISGYKEKRNHHLEILATKTAKEVAKTKVTAELKNLNSYERRIIHTKLSQSNDVITESVGEEPNRYLVIKAK